VAAWRRLLRYLADLAGIAMHADATRSGDAYAYVVQIRRGTASTP